MNWITNLPRMLACGLQAFTPSAPFVEGSLNGKHAIITGGNSGIGYETALAMAVQGCKVTVLCRNPSKAQDATNAINARCLEKGSKGSCEAMPLDLADLESVKACIQLLRVQLLDGQVKVDFLLCNGGIMMQPYAVSPQGHEIHFATNHLGHFALVGGLIDFLRRDHSKVVVLTGDIAVLADDASPDFVYSDSGLQAYCRSKICNQSFGKELHSRYAELSVFVVHPGVINSHLVETMGGALGTIEGYVRPLFMITCEQGAQSSLLCCLSDSVPKGSYYHNAFGVTDYHPTVHNQAWNDWMWNLSAKLCAQAGVELFY